jgi:hypothetical protein
MTRFRLFATIALAMAAVAGCRAQRSVDLAAEETAIRTTNATWLAAATAHDLERVLPLRGVCHARIFDHLDSLKKLKCPSRATWLTPPEPAGFP